MPKYTEELTKDRIDAIFSAANQQVDYMIGLYRAVVPDYDNIDHMTAYPCCNEQTSNYIYENAIRFDKEHHPKVLAGGAWMNRGFTIKRTVPDWRVEIDPDTIQRK